MRTNYKAIENMIKRNFNFDDIRNSPSKGKIVVFTEGTEHVRIVLVDGNCSKNEQGIHIKGIQTKAELEHHLVDACQTALKDNFSTIFVHMKPKPNPERRLRRLDSVKAWLVRGDMVCRMALNYSLENSSISDAEAVLTSMNEEQLDVLMALVSASYSGGCESTRAFFKKCRERETSETKGA